MTTLFDMVLGACDKMGISKHSMGTAAGTTTSITDTGIASQTADDDFVGGTIFIVSAPGAATSVDGTFRQITAYTPGVFTFSTIAAASSNSVVYAYVTPEFSNQLLIQKANEALVSLGPLVYVAKDTITSSGAQDEYNASSTWKYSNPLRIDLQTSIASTSDENDWQELYDWEYEPSTAGGTGKIIFKAQPPSGRKFRVWYQRFHEYVSASTQVIDERINPEIAKLALVEKLYEYRNSLNRGSVEFDKQRWTDAKTQVATAKTMMPIWKPKRKRKLNIVGEQGGDDHPPYPHPYGPK